MLTYIRSEAQYNRKIKGWGVQKHTTPAQMKAAIRKKRQRDQLGKKTEVKINGHVINSARLARYIRDHGLTSMQDLPQGNNIFDRTIRKLSETRPAYTSFSQCNDAQRRGRKHT